jgi:TM2 domain-containing membrane protein YozV
MPGEKSPVIALILSFFLTGLGQMYNREISKGIIFLIVAILLGILTFIFVYTCVISIPFWIYGMYDAYTRADMYNRSLRATGRPPW